MDSITFYGTSAGTPLSDRNVSSLILKMKNKSLCLVDCGDGTCNQLIKGKIKTGRLVVIFITHMHSDHTLGLPGLLSYVRLSSITIVGPVGIRGFVEAVFSAIPSDSQVHKFPSITYVELEPDRAYPTVPLSSDVQVKLGRVSVGAYPLAHRCPCFGYVFSELDDVWKFDSKKAMELGARGPELGRLSHWEEVTPAAGGLPIKPQDVLTIACPKRKAAVLGDTDATKTPVETTEAIRGCDLLVHESTYLDSDTEKTALYGHSTTKMACAFAKSVGAKTLLLNHLSPSVHLEDMQEEAKSFFGENATVASDFQQFKI